MRPQIFGTPTGPLPEYITASQRVTTLPRCNLDEDVSRAVRLAVRDVQDTTSLAHGLQTTSLLSHELAELAELAH